MPAASDQWGGRLAFAGVNMRFKFASNLSDLYVWADGWDGQSNARPWGTREEGFAEGPHLSLSANGVDITDLRVQTGTGTETTTCRTVLTRNEWVGARLQCGRPGAPVVGYGTVTSNITLSGTFTADAGTNTLTNLAGAHGLENNEIVTVAGTTLPGGLAANTTYWVVNKAASTFQLSATRAGAAIDLTTAGSGALTWYCARITIAWTKASAAAATINAYTTRTDGRWKKYDNIRVLTPYQPDAGGAYPTGTPTVFGYTVDESVTSYADLGLFLELTMLEGIEGHGVCEATSGNHVPASADSVSMTLTGAALVAGELAGAYLIVNHGGGRSWAIVDDNSTDAFTGVTWNGDGTPSGTASEWTYEAWLPHHQDNPHAFLPGPGFRYPNHDMMPCAFSTNGGKIHNRPRGITTYSYGNRFGALLPCFWDVSVRTGKTAYVVHLGINSSGQIASTTNNYFGFPGILGWWDYTKHLTWSRSIPDANQERYERMLTVMAPAALLTAGISKPLRYRSFVRLQGEADALSVVGREIYDETMAASVARLRKVVTDAGLNPYPSPAKIPLVQPQITHVPYELEGAFSYYNQLSGLTINFNGTGDSQGQVNSSIVENATIDGFIDGSIDTDNYTKLGDTSLTNGIDLLHYDGKAAVQLGRVIADKQLAMVDLAASFLPDDRAVGICNDALRLVGDYGEITSLEAPYATEQAKHCAELYLPTLNLLLQLGNFGFNMRRKPLVALTNDRTEWQYAYALPPEACKVIRVLPKDAPDDYQMQVARSPRSYQPEPSQPSIRFVIEQDGFGNKLLRTNLVDAHLCYVKFGTDTRVMSEAFLEGLKHALAAKLAPALVKGDQGVSLSQKLLPLANAWLIRARVLDGQQRNNVPSLDPDWITDR